MNVNYNKLGFRIAFCRKELHMTQEELSDITGISKNHISKMENGGNPSLKTFLSICEALKVTPDYIIKGTIYDGDYENLVDTLKLCNSNEITIINNVVNALIENRQRI